MSTPHGAATAGWLDHTGATRRETESTVLASLTKAYPDYHVTRTNASKCDVLGYAYAGFAIAIHSTEAGYDATRVYRPPHSRLDEAMGKLDDVVNFGKWQYEYDGNNFFVYEMTYQNKYMEVIRVPYILAPRSEADLDGLHHKKTDALLLAAGIWTKDVHEQVWVYDDQEWTKSSSLYQAVQGTTWDDVVLEPSMRAKLHRDVHGFFDNRELYRKAKIPWKRGIIFHGVPGNGKSMTLAVTINELAKRSPPVPALYVKSLDACAGPKWSLQEIFTKARRTAPCLLVLEDLDSLVTDNTRSYFLNQVDGLESNDGILIIGSTNHLDRLDTSVTKRPSRFDRKYHFKLPEEAERLAYCRYWRNKFSHDDSDFADFTDEMCEIVAKWTVSYSFAYLKELFVTSLLLHTHGEDEEDEQTAEANDAVKDVPAPLEINGAAKSARGSELDDSPANNGEPAQADEATINGDKPSADAHTESNNTDKAAAEAAAEPITEETPRTLPDIPIPPSLQDNALLKIFRTQAQTLLEEMDTSGGEKDRKSPAPTGDPPIKFKLPSLLDGEGD